MKLSALWSIVHDWNATRQHRTCMVCIADAWDLSTEGLLNLSDTLQPQPSLTHSTIIPDSYFHH